MVASILRQMCLSKYIKSSVPEPDEEKDSKGWNKWNQEQGIVVTLLQSTLHKTIPKHSEDYIDQIAIQLANCKIADYLTLQAFRDDLQYMKKCLKELKLELSEGFLLAIILKKIENVLPEMHAFARRDYKLGMLTWNTLMAEINSAIITSIDNKAFSFFKKTAQTLISSNASGGAQEGARQWPRENFLLSTSIINSVKLPKLIIEKISYYCQCKKYLISSWKHYKECGKCYSTSRRSCRNNTQGQTAQPTSTSSLITAELTVFGGSSVASKPATVAISALVENGKLSRDSIITDISASETLFNNPK
ncbi:hypothetical protein M406DRAFT_74869 [Cryphonectria parasitica EP155]|uniref:Uncharacterized protein n=1 Tax=Cryphonectria parasitica (strain ATCC 38755 / EP155) TaxID=660469 RepID=A0A9P5CLE7_CRYP1|nr:uncharacterized protein M406DRAFT_74869 [Cryphonectria parasitica EP155]KAF3761946.1 hypothetical protein M406DRAFT_74869 [Cryphonectria parasitica EP155]